MDWATIEKEIQDKTTHAIRSKVGLLDESNFSQPTELEPSPSPFDSYIPPPPPSASIEGASTIGPYANYHTLDQEFRQLQALVIAQDQRIQSLERTLITHTDSIESNAGTTLQTLESFDNRLHTFDSNQQALGESQRLIGEQVDVLSESSRRIEGRTDDQGIKMRALTEASESVIQLLQSVLTQVMDIRNEFDQYKVKNSEESTISANVLRTVKLSAGGRFLDKSKGDEKENNGDGRSLLHSKEITHLFCDAVISVIETTMANNELGSIPIMLSNMNEIEKRVTEDLMRIKNLEGKSENIETLLGNMSNSIFKSLEAQKSQQNVLDDVQKSVDAIKLTKLNDVNKDEMTQKNMEGVDIEKFDHLSRKLYEKMDSKHAEIDGKLVDMTATMMKSLDSALAKVQADTGKESGPEMGVETSGINEERLKGIEDQVVKLEEHWIPYTDRLTEAESSIKTLFFTTNTHDNHITALQTAAKDAESVEAAQLDDMISKLHELESDYKGMEGALAGVRDQLSGLQDQCSQMVEDVRNIEQQNITNKDTYIQQPAFNSLNSRVRAAQSAITALQSEIAVLQDSHTETQMMLEKKKSPSNETTATSTSTTEATTSKNMTAEVNSTVTESTGKTIKMKGGTNTKNTVTSSKLESSSEKVMVSDGRYAVDDDDFDAVAGQTHTKTKVSLPEPDPEDLVQDLEEAVFTSDSSEDEELNKADGDDSLDQVGSNDDDADADLAHITKHIGKNVVTTTSSSPRPSSTKKSKSPIDSFDDDGRILDPVMEGQGRENIFDRIRRSPRRSPVPLDTKSPTTSTLTPTPYSSSIATPRTGEPPLSEAQDLQSSTKMPKTDNSPAHVSSLPTVSGSLLSRGAATATTGQPHSVLPPNGSFPLELSTAKAKEEATSYGKSSDDDYAIYGTKTIKTNETITYESSSSAAATAVAAARTMGMGPLGGQPQLPRSTGRSDSAQCQFCLRRMPKSQMADHNRICALRIEVCTLGCGQRIRFIKMDKHIKDECPRRSGASKPAPPS
jgi:hypothetical protein